MPKTWKDQHSLACACKACAAKPTFATKSKPVLGSLIAPPPPVVDWVAPKPLPFGLLKCDEITPTSIFDEVEPAPKPDFAVAVVDEVVYGMSASGAKYLPAISGHTLKVEMTTAGEAPKVYLDGQPILVQTVEIKSAPHELIGFSSFDIAKQLLADWKPAPLPPLPHFDYSKLPPPLAAGGIFSPSALKNLMGAPPKIDLIDSSNPFAQALDAWQTGKVAWVKGAMHKKVPDEERANA